jgi:hypothetical protein
MPNVLEKLFAALPFVSGRMKEKNESFDTFIDLEKKETDHEEVESVIGKVMDSSQSRSEHETINAYKDLIYGALSSNKPSRIAFFRRMSLFPEVGDAIDEICDSCINYDDNQNFVNIHFKNSKTLKDEQKESVQDEFEKFISLYDFENNGFEYFRSLVVDGEISFENVISEKKPEQGIINVKRIMPESYELLVDLCYNIVGIIVNAQIACKSNEKNSNLTNQTSYAQNEIRKATGVGQTLHSYQSNGPEEDLLVLPKKQVTLIDTGVYNDDKSIVYPVLERARRAYRQLSLIEDAIIIYRLVRAPERLVFNVDTGKLPPSRAEQMVKKMMHKYQTKKIYDPVNGTVVNDYDAHQMMESYWFPKPEGSDGTNVETLGGAQSLGELDDLNYFLRKLYLSLKIPYDRFEEGRGETKETGESISYEEYRFAKFIMRIQNRFSKGVNDSFITHLQLTGIWDKFKLNKRSFNVRFNPPTSFDLYETQKLLNIKMENYTLVADQEDFSNDLAKIKYLGMSQEEITKNYEMVEKEKIREAMLERKLSNVEEYGTTDPPPEPPEDEESW